MASHAGVARAAVGGGELAVGVDALLHLGDLGGAQAFDQRAARAVGLDRESPRPRPRANDCAVSGGRSRAVQRVAHEFRAMHDTVAEPRSLACVVRAVWRGHAEP